MSGALKNDEILWTKPFILTLLASFLIFIPYSLYLPILPIYVLDELHGSFAAAGMVNAIFLFASVLFRSQTGRLENRFGIRVILLASGCMFLLSNSLFLLTDSTVMVVIIRFFSGACFAIVNTSIQAVGSRIAPLKRKGEGLGYLTMVITAGCAIGPYTGLKLARAYGFAWVFVFSTVVVLVGFIFSTFIPIEEQKTDRECHPARIKLKDLIEMRAIPASSIALLLSFAYAAVISFVTVYANQIQLSVAAAYFFVVLAVFSIGSRFFSGRLQDKFGANIVVYPSIAMFAIGLFILGTASSSLHMLVAAALIGLAFGAIVPGLLTLADQQSPRQRTSAVMATFFTFLDMGLGIGAYLVGVCLPLFGYANLYLVLGFLVLGVGLFYYKFVCKKEQVVWACP